MMEDNIRDKVLDSVRDLRKEIIGRGGDISPLAGLKDFPRAIYNIPADNAITTITQEEVSQFKKVPENSTKYAYLAKFGGMTYKCSNLIPYPFNMPDRNLEGIDITTNNGVVTLNGTGAISSVSDFVLLPANFILPSGTYTLSGCVDGGTYTYKLFVWILKADGSNLYISQSSNAQTFTINDGDVVRTCSVRLGKDIGTVSNIIIKPMLNIDKTARPFEPYYEGLRNTKPTEIVSEGTQGNIISTRAIPEEIQSLEDFGVGVDVKYNNHIEIRDGRVYYVQEVVKIVLDGVTAGLKVHYAGSTYGTISPKIAGVVNANIVWAGGIGLKGAAIPNSSGMAITSNIYKTVDEYNAMLQEEYSKGNPVTVVYPIVNPIVTELPISMSPIIEVECGGTVEFVNEYGYGVPSKIVYQTKQSEVI